METRQQTVDQLKDSFGLKSTRVTSGVHSRVVMLLISNIVETKFEWEWADPV